MIRSPDGSNSTSSLNAAEIYYIHNDRPIYNTTLYTNDAPCPPVSFANPVKLVPFDKYSDSYFGSTIITWDRHSGVIPSIKDPYGLDVRSGIIKSKAEVDLPENERHLIPPGSRLFKCDVNGQTAQYGIYWKVVLQNGQETDFSLYQDTAVFESWRLYSRQNKKEGYPP